MTLTELKALSDELTSDADFLAHEKVRGVYWKALGEERFMHLWAHVHTQNRGWVWSCSKCHSVRADETSTPFDCEYPDSIPGSLADAVERLRERAVEKWNEELEFTMREALDLTYAGHDGYAYEVFQTARDRFIIFAALAGGTEGD